MANQIWLDKQLRSDMRFRRVVAKLQARMVKGQLGSPEIVLLGALADLWGFADDHIGDENELEATAVEVDELVMIPGFCAMLPDDWCVVLPDGRLHLPNFIEKNTWHKDYKAQNRNRQRSFRARRREQQGNADLSQSNVTESQRSVTDNVTGNGVTENVTLPILSDPIRTVPNRSDPHPQERVTDAKTVESEPPAKPNGSASGACDPIELSKQIAGLDQKGWQCYVEWRATSKWGAVKQTESALRGYLEGFSSHPVGLQRIAFSKAIVNGWKNPVWDDATREYAALQQTKRANLPVERPVSPLVSTPGIKAEGLHELLVKAGKLPGGEVAT